VSAPRPRRALLATLVGLTAVAGLVACEPVPDGAVAVAPVADAEVASTISATGTVKTSSTTATTRMTVVTDAATTASAHVAFDAPAEPWAVTSAILELDVITAGSPIEVWSSAGFVESAITWTTRPETLNQVSTVRPVVGPMQIDVTTAVRAGHRAFALVPTGPARTSIATREDASDAVRPRLLVWRGAVRTMPTSIVGQTTCSTAQADQTAQIQAWLDSVPDGSIARFPAGRCFRTEVPLVVLGRKALTIDGNGSALEAFTDGCDDQSANGIAYDDCRYLPPNEVVAHEWPYLNSRVHLEKSTNVLIRNLRVDGGFNVTGTITPMEGNHAFRIGEGNRGTILDGVRADRVQGDYAYIQGSNDTTIQNSTFGEDHGALSGNGRQGLGLTRGTGVYVRGNVFSNVTRSHVDIEPNYVTDVIRDVFIDRNTFNGPKGTAWFSNANDSITERVSFRWNRLVGIHLNAQILNSPLPDPTNPASFRRRDYAFIGNTSDTPGANPLGMLLRVQGIDGVLIQGNSVVAKPLRDIALIDAKSSRDVVVIDNSILNGSEAGRYPGSVAVCERGNRVGNPLVADPTQLAC
jgi:hypothetical protein